LAINHNINAEDNSLAEIEDQIVKAGADVETVKIEENKVFAQEKQEAGFEAGQESGATGSASTIGSNRVDVALDVATGATGLPSLELGRMAVDVLSDRGSIFKSVDEGIKSKSGKRDSLFTGHSSKSAMLGFRTNAMEDFNSMGVKGAQINKGSAPSCKHEKALVMGKRMAHEQTFHAAMAARNQFTTPGMGGGAKPATLEKFMVPKGYVDPEELKWKDEHKNRDIWGGEGTTA